MDVALGSVGGQLELARLRAVAQGFYGETIRGNGLRILCNFRVCL